MVRIIFLLLGIIVGALLVAIYFKIRFKNWDEKCRNGGKRIDAINEERIREKESRKRQIMDLFNKQKKVANRDVEGLLNISDASATNYLDELEKEGKIKQVNNVGRGVYYKLTK